MARGSVSQPDSPVTIRHPERNSVVLDRNNDANEKRESRSESSSATLLEMETVHEPRKLDYLDLEKQVGDGPRPNAKLRYTRARLTLWMTVNTVATVAIVSIAIYTTNTFRADCSPGLHQQNHLRRSCFSPIPSCLRHLPPVHHRPYALYPFPTLHLPLRPKPDAPPPNAPTCNHHVP